MLKDLGDWIANTRRGRLIFGVLTLVLVGGGVFFVISAEVGRRSAAIVKKIEADNPCVTLQDEVRAPAPENLERVQDLSRGCRRYLVSLSELVPERFACAVIKAGSYPCPRPGTAAAREAERRAAGDRSGDDASTTTSQPGDGGPRGGQGGGHGGGQKAGPKQGDPAGEAAPGGPTGDTPGDTPADTKPPAFTPPAGGNPPPEEPQPEENPGNVLEAGLCVRAPVGICAEASAGAGRPK